MAFENNTAFSANNSETFAIRAFAEAKPFESLVRDEDLDEDTVEEIEVIFEPGTKLQEIERIVILKTLKAQRYNRTHAARVLGIGIRTLQRKLKKYGVANIGMERMASSA